MNRLGSKAAEVEEPAGPRPVKTLALSVGHPGTSPQDGTGHRPWACVLRSQRRRAARSAITGGRHPSLSTPTLPLSLHPCMDVCVRTCAPARTLLAGRGWGSKHDQQQMQGNASRLVQHDRHRQLRVFTPHVEHSTLLTFA